MKHDDEGSGKALCMTMLLQQAALTQGREVLIWRDVDGKGYRADFEDGRCRIEAWTILELVAQLKEQSVSPGFVRVEVDGDRALSSNERAQVFQLLQGELDIPDLFGSDSPSP